MLSGGGHVKIGSYEYMLDDSKPDPYQHNFESLFSQTTAIAGEIAKQQLRPEKMLWYETDWSGGEGYRIYHPQEPTRYDQSSLMNVTQAGLLTTRARRSRTSLARSGSTATTALRPAGGSVWNKAGIFWGDNAIYSTDAAGWTASTSALVTATYEYYDCDTDGRYLLPGVIVEGTSSANQLPSMDGSMIVPVVADIYSGTTTINPPIVCEVLEGVAYAWAPDSSGIMELTKGLGPGTASAFATVVYSSGFVPTGVWGTNYWTDIETADAALYMSLGTPNGSVVFESRQDIGRPFWTSPPGFTIKKLIYHSGVLFCLGTQSASGKRFAALWAVPLSTRAPIFIAAPRRHRNVELFEWTIGCPGYGNTIFVADENSGKIFLYDIERDALSLFDDLANGGTGDGTSFTVTNGPQLLAPFQSTLEGMSMVLSGWVDAGGTPVVVTTGIPHGGSYCLSNTSAADGVATTLTGLQGVPILPSTSYTVSYWHVRNAGGYTTTQQIALKWYTSAGALISTSSDSAVADTTSYQQQTYTTTSPATAAYVALQWTIDNTGGVNNSYADDFLLYQSTGSVTDKLAFLAMHGSRLFGATWQPQGGVGTSLQIISWDDTLKENRDASQAISATLETSEWDFGVPQEQKALNGVYVNYEITDNATTSGLVADSRITISYALDDKIFTNTYTDLTAMTSATTVLAKGRHFIPVSDGSSTIKFNRIKFKITLDNNSSTTVAPPIVYSVVPEAQLLAYSETWDLTLRIQDEADNSRPASRQWRAHQLRDNLEDLAQNKAYVTLLDGVRYGNKVSEWTTHTVQVEDPQDFITNVATGEGYMRVRLRAVPV